MFVFLTIEDFKRIHKALIYDFEENDSDVSGNLKLIEKIANALAHFKREQGKNGTKRVSSRKRKNKTKTKRSIIT